MPLRLLDFWAIVVPKSAGDTRFPLLATICGIVFGRLLPALAFLALGLPIESIFVVMLLDYIIKSCMLLSRYRSGKWLHLKLAGASTSDN